MKKWTVTYTVGRPARDRKTTEVEAETEAEAKAITERRMKYSQIAGHVVSAVEVRADSVENLESTYPKGNATLNGEAQHARLDAAEFALNELAGRMDALGRRDTEEEWYKAGPSEDGWQVVGSMASGRRWGVKDPGGNIKIVVASQSEARQWLKKFIEDRARSDSARLSDRDIGLVRMASNMVQRGQMPLTEAIKQLREVGIDYRSISEEDWARVQVRSDADRDPGPDNTLTTPGTEGRMDAAARYEVTFTQVERKTPDGREVFGGRYMIVHAESESEAKQMILRDFPDARIGKVTNIGPSNRRDSARADVSAPGYYVRNVRGDAIEGPFETGVEARLACGDHEARADGAYMVDEAVEARGDSFESDLSDKDLETSIASTERIISQSKDAPPEVAVQLLRRLLNEALRRGREYRADASTEDKRDYLQSLIKDRKAEIADIKRKWDEPMVSQEAWRSRAKERIAEAEAKIREHETALSRLDSSTARTDPPVSEAQRRFFRWASENPGASGVSKKVSGEFNEADPGGKLPERKAS